jgi:Domain of unknown function (DUF4386)
MDSIPPRLGAVAANLGALMLLAGTTLHPMSADPGDPIAAFTEYGADTHWAASHLMQFAGVTLLFLGLAALADTMRDQPGGWLARLGIFIGVGALAGSAVLQAVDGFALKAMVDQWAAAAPGEKDAAFRAAYAVRQIETGTAAYSAMLFGLAVTLLGAAMAASTAYPKWLGALGVAAGLGTLAGGLAMAFTGFSALAMTVGMPANLAVVGWVVATGAMMWRKA